MTCLTATEARTKLYRLLDEDWQSIQETLYLSSIPGMRASIIKGLKTPVEDCFEELSW
ncbi:type II toxin-antitoxin system prevent-host-death family antitoxin [bacterium]|nr:type II toxin-antitoxin system prevent-host-death family antitoxin [bacterium]